MIVVATQDPYAFQSCDYAMKSVFAYKMEFRAFPGQRRDTLTSR